MTLDRFRAGWLARVAAVCLLAPVVSTAAGAAAPGKGRAAESPDAGLVTVKVVERNGKTPVRGATVRAVRLDDGKAFDSAPTGSNGEAVVAGLPYGYYDVVVATEEGAFVGDRVVLVPPRGKAALVLTLVKAGAPGSDASFIREVPGSGKAADGTAELLVKPRGPDYWKTPKGMAIIGAASGAALLLIVTGSGESDASYYY